jgi:hypothetical protein
MVKARSFGVPGAARALIAPLMINNYVRRLKTRIGADVPRGETKRSGISRSALPRFRSDGLPTNS